MNTKQSKTRKPIQQGDVFALGEHRLMCGDATDKQRIDAFLGEQQIHVLLTDVPYGVDVVASNKSFGKNTRDHIEIANDHLQTTDEFCTFSEQWLSTINDHFARKNSIYVFNSDKMMFPLERAIRKCGGKVAQLLVWVKTGAVIGRLDYLPQHELIAYGWFGVHQFYKSKDKSVLITPKTRKKTLHPTMKPVPLLRRLILNSSTRGEMVYDPFGGSGSTLIACEQTKRRCFMVELEPHYCGVIIKRWEKLTGQVAQKI